MLVTDTHDFESDSGRDDGGKSTSKRWRQHYESLAVPRPFAATVGAVAGTLAGISCAASRSIEAGRSLMQELGDPDEGDTMSTTPTFRERFTQVVTAAEIGTEAFFSGVADLVSILRERNRPLEPMVVETAGSLVVEAEDRDYDNPFNPARGRYVGMDDPVL